MAGLGPVGPLCVLEVEVHIVCHHEIEPAVAVIIDKRATRSPAGPDAWRRDVREGSVPAVAEQQVFSPVGNVEIDEAIVIDVAGAHPLSPARFGEPRLSAYVLKCAVALVAVKVVHRLLTRWKAIELRRRNGENIHQAIVVEIEEGYAGA